MLRTKIERIRQAVGYDATDPRIHLYHDLISFNLVPGEGPLFTADELRAMADELDREDSGAATIEEVRAGIQELLKDLKARVAK